MARKLKAAIDIETARTNRRVKNLNQELRKTRETTSKVGKEGTRDMGLMGRATEGATRAVTGLIGAYAGFQGVRMLMASLRREIELTEETTKRALQAMRGIEALSMMKGRRKEERELVKELSRVAGRPLEAIAPAYYGLVGGMAKAAPARRAGIMRQAVQWMRTDPSADPEALVRMLSTMANQFPELSPQQIGNLASQTIEMAMARPTEMANVLPRVMATATAIGGDVTMPMAMFSMLSRTLGDPAMAGTSARAIIMGLTKPSGPALRQMRGLGFRPDWDIMQKLQWLGQAEGQLSPELKAALGGRRGILALPAITQRPEEFAAERRGIGEALAAPGSLFQQRLTSLYGENQAQAYLDQSERAKIAMQQLYMQPGVMRRGAREDLVELYRKQKGDAPYWRGARAWWRDVSVGVGGQPYETLARENLDYRIMFQLLEEGYAPERITTAMIGAVGGAGPRGSLEQRTRGLLGEGGARPIYSGVQINNAGTVHVHTDKRGDGDTPDRAEGAPSP